MEKQLFCHCNFNQASNQIMIDEENFSVTNTKFKFPLNEYQNEKYKYLYGLYLDCDKFMAENNGSLALNRNGDLIKITDKDIPFPELTENDIINLGNEDLLNVFNENKLRYGSKYKDNELIQISLYKNFYETKADIVKKFPLLNNICYISRDNDEIISKIEEIDRNEILYLTYDRRNSGDEFTIPKNNIEEVKIENPLVIRYYQDVIENVLKTYYHK